MRQCAGFAAPPFGTTELGLVGLVTARAARTTSQRCALARRTSFRPRVRGRSSMIVGASVGKGEILGGGFAVAPGPQFVADSLPFAKRAETGPFYGDVNERVLSSRPPQR